MMSHRSFFVILGASAASVVLLWGADIPLGVPGEWTWSRIRYADNAAVIDGLLGVVGAVAVGTVYVGLVVLGQRRITVSKRGEVASWLAGLAVAGFAWLWFVQQSPPAEYGLSRSVFVLHDPGASGYFTVARNEASDVSRFLATYEARMVEGDVFHVGTHPPGLFLLHRGLLATCEWSPTMTSLVNTTRPLTVLDTFESINTYVRSTDPLTESEQAALWLGVLLTQAVAVAALLPLYLLVRQTHSRSAAWMAAAFWPLTPALAVFLPKSDALYPFLGLLFLWLWQEGLLRRRGWMCALAGLTMWAGLLMSLALLPVALFAVLRTGWGVWKPEADEPPRRFVVTATTWAGGMFAVATLLFYFVGDANLITIWNWNLGNHAAFYDQFTRTYWKWWLVNPLEFSMAVGLPMTLLAGLAVRQVITSESSARAQQLGIPLACLLVWGLLWLSGKNMGEAARLWLVLAPWPIWMAAGCFDETQTHKTQAHVATERPSTWSRTLIGILVVQLIVSLATVMRVSGFDFAGAG